MSLNNPDKEYKTTVKSPLLFFQMIQRTALDSFLTERNKMNFKCVEIERAAKKRGDWQNRGPA